MSDGQNTDEVEQIVANVRAAFKYRNVCAETVRRFAVEEWAKRWRPGWSHGQSPKRALKEAIKATRSRLHQAYSAYESRASLALDYERAYRDLEVAYAEGTAGAAREACRPILALHASTRERLPILDRFYDQVFAHTGVPHALLDLACGLNPLSLPWMGLGEGAAYYAYDIDGQRVVFLNRYLSLAGMEAHARLQDILCDPPVERGDVALLMKSSACLERQREGATLALLDALDVQYVVVTFPLQSLGRREKGMPEHYERTFLDMVVDRPWPVTRLRFASELAFIVDKALADKALADKG